MSLFSPLTKAYGNFKVANKLIIGFGVVLLLGVAIAASGISHMSAIGGRVQKIQLLKGINDEFLLAKDSRLKFVKTHDKQYIDENEQHLKKLELYLEQAKEFTWLPRNAELLAHFPSLLEIYRTERQNTVNAVARRDALSDALSFTDEWKLLGTLEDKIKAAGAERNADLQLAFQMRDSVNFMRSEARGLRLFNTDSAQQALMKALDEAQHNADLLRPHLTPSELPLLETVAQNITRSRATVPDYMPAFNAENDATAALSKAGLTLTDSAAEMFASQIVNTHDEIASGNREMLWIVGIAIALGVFISWAITRMITQPLNQTLLVAQQVAAGDLRTDLNVETRDEMGQLMGAVNTMSGNLRQIIQDIRDGVTQVVQASGEISAGNTDLSSRTEQQVAALGETAASMEQLTATVKQNADNAQQATRLAGEASDTAHKGGEMVQGVVGVMKEIAGSSQQISEITSVINSIAFKTNILALNAAVEAARAGEQGRGFAVVAGEVRNLAQHSAQAATEIERLISDSVQRAANGSALVEKTGAVMNEIVSSVGHVTSIMQEIATASNEQSQGISQIAQAVNEMDSVTQQNAALVEESAAAAASLDHQAAILNQAVSVFKLGDR